MSYLKHELKNSNEGGNACEQGRGISLTGVLRNSLFHQDCSEHAEGY